MRESPPVILVTGAARRVGAAICRTLHAAGCDLAIHYRNSRVEAEALCAELCASRADSAACFAANLLATDASQELIGAVGKRFGRLDGLVNNASSFYPTPLAQASAQQWDDLVGSNMKAPLLLASAAAEMLRASRGAIVNIIDIHAERPLAGYPIYSAAKAGLLGATRALAIELAPEIRVNGVAPGAILWPEDGQFGMAEREAIVRHTPLKREGRPEDIASAVRFLLLDAPYITGQMLAVDGGRSIVL